MPRTRNAEITLVVRQLSFRQTYPGFMERIANNRRPDLLHLVGRHLPRLGNRAAAARLGNFISEDPAWDDAQFEDDLAPDTNLGTPIAE